MNLWLRQLRLLICLPFRPKLGLLDVSRLTVRVWPNDLDTNLHMNNGRYLTLADLGRVDWSVRSGALRLARQRGAMPVVGDAIAKFRRSLEPFQRFTLETRLLGWDEKWAYIEHRFIRQGRVLGVIVIRGVFVSKTGSVPPDELLTSLDHHQPSPALPQWVLDWANSCNDLSHQLRREEGRLP